MALFKPENVEDFYELQEVLGSGHFGQVRRVRERSTGQHYAAKFLKVFKNTRSLHGLERSQVEREVNILQALRHSNIVALKDLFESREEVALILELVSGGELFDFIAEKDELLESEAILFMRQILQGLSYMHQQHIAHFDLKVDRYTLFTRSGADMIKILFKQLEKRHFDYGKRFKTSKTLSRAPISQYGPLCLS